jgi:hypothetical protein
MSIPQTPGIDLEPVTAFPTQREVAAMLRVGESRLSKLNAERITVSPREVRYRPRVVLELAAHYRKRSLNEVAGDLVSYAQEHAPELLENVRQEIEDFFANRATPPVDRAVFLQEARRTLPRRVFEQVRKAYDVGGAQGEPLEFVSASAERDRPHTADGSAG